MRIMVYSLSWVLQDLYDLIICMSLNPNPFARPNRVVRVRERPLVQGSAVALRQCSGLNRSRKMFSGVFSIL